MAVIDIIPKNEHELTDMGKESLSELAKKLAKQFGPMKDEDRLSAYIKLVKLKQLIIYCLSEVKEPCVSSAEKMGFNKKQSFDNVAVQVVNKNEYDYLSCDDDEFDELTQAIKECEKKLADRKKFLRGLSEPTYDHQEKLILPPEVECKQSLSISY
jgi:hypothetical protein